MITVEGIGNSKRPHPVQERIAKWHGSQCGFCTPGIVMVGTCYLLPGSWCVSDYVGKIR